MALVLAIPVIVAANLVDPTWIPGLYDDADSDQLITHTLSPEGLIGPTVLALAYILWSATFVSLGLSWRRKAAVRNLAARGPPSLTARSAASSDAARGFHRSLRAWLSCQLMFPPRASHSSQSTAGDSIPDQSSQDPRRRSPVVRPAISPLSERRLLIALKPTARAAALDAGQRAAGCPGNIASSVDLLHVLLTRTTMPRRAALALTVIGLVACASEVARRPTQFTPLAGEREASIEVLADLRISVGPGYERVIRKGDVWTRIGRIAEGEVYKPVGRVFTVEGAQVREAYLVLDGDRVIGFYLPVERAFSPASAKSNTRLSLQRRSP